MISRLRDITELDRSYDHICEDTSGILDRLHIASVLVSEGTLGSVDAAFDRYLGTNGGAFVPMERVPALTVIKMLRRAGGVVFLAHPGRIRTDLIERIVESLASDGLDAIEVPYPYTDVSRAAYAVIDASDAAALERDFSLLHTGGSGCHGRSSGEFRIGHVRISRHHHDALQQRASERHEI